MGNKHNFESLENERNCKLVTGVMKMLSHPGRLRLLCYLTTGPKNVGEIQEHCGLSQPHISQCLSKMHLQGIVKSHREGNFVLYSLRDRKIIQLIKFIQKTYCEK
jgi:ArsR family transcriptional regulator, virulence genes transcriptional regulator